MELSRFLKTYPCPDKPGRVLVVATRRCAVLELSGAKLAAARDGRLDDPDRATLTRLGVLTPNRDAERDDMRDTFTRVNRTCRHVAVLVTLTLECNLACGYCFEDPFRGRFSMSVETADLLVLRMTEQMAAGRNVTVDFYGGEPLLALSLLRRIAGNLAVAARTHGVTFSFNIITNGTLLNRRIVQELLPLGLTAVRVTLDGPRDVHDCQRPFVSGQGSFDVVLAAIRETVELVPLDLGGNYTRTNYHRFPELLDCLIAEGITPHRLKAVVFSPVMPKADGSMSGDCGAVCAGSDDPEMREAGLFLRGEILKRGFPAPRLRSHACMIEFDHDLVVGYDGTLHKCPLFMGDKELSVGSLSEGVGDYCSSHNLEVWKTEECLDCAYLPLCFGGCRFLRKVRTGAIDGVDCRRDYFDATLERLIRQDLMSGMLTEREST
jgi:uncharacterized protein